MEPSEARKKSYTTPYLKTLDLWNAAAELQAKRLTGDENSQKPGFRFVSLRSVPRIISLLVLVSALTAQVAEHATRIGFPQDWTHRHVLFHRQMLRQHPQLAAEPRVLHQFIRKLPYSAVGAFQSSYEIFPKRTDALRRDWNVNLGVGKVAFGMSPVKYGFDVNAAPSCANDFAAFGLDVAGVTGGQANLVAFNNLYRGPGGLCGTGAPSTLFSYNTTTVVGGSVDTSPVLSLDGAKIAFVESTPTSSIFHVLTWATGPGNGTSPITSAAPGVGNTATMTSLTYAAANTNTRSSPWIDYDRDVAYVGADDGRLYKITGVFKGTPSLAGAPWPVLINNNRRLTGPVLDQLTGNIFVGDARGILWSVNANAPATIRSLNVGLAGATNPAIFDPPIVDVDNGTVFAISSNDGTSAVVVQADTSTLAQLTRARIGQGSTGAFTANLYGGAFTDAYFNNPASGFLFLCGTGGADTTPWRYSFGFTGRILNAAPASSGQILNFIDSRCSPITEFFNPNIGATGTDFFFWGMTSNCVGASGCIMSRTTSDVVLTVSESNGTSSIIIDNVSTAAHASSIYFTNQGAPRRAVKLTQNGLQ
jgi:hypothetical protein